MSAHESQVIKDATAQVKADTPPSELADRKRFQALLSAQTRSQQLIAGGSRLTEVFQDLCDTIAVQRAGFRPLRKSL